MTKARRGHDDASSSAAHAARGLGARPRLHGHERVLRPARRAPSRSRRIHRALELGVTFLDTADMYGPFTQRGAGRRARSRGRRDQRGARDQVRHRARRPTARPLGISGKPEYVRQACDAIARSGSASTTSTSTTSTASIPTTPIEDTVGAMAELVSAGKVRYLGLSEAAPETIRRAHAVHPITALQTEYSLWTRDPEDDGCSPTCRELGIGFVAYSPLGRGFLTGQFTQGRRPAAPDDYRRHSPRFQGENFAKNLELVERTQAARREKGATPRRSSRWPGCCARRRHRADPRHQARSYLEENLGRARDSCSAPTSSRASTGSRRAARPPASAIRRTSPTSLKSCASTDIIASSDHDARRGRRVADVAARRLRKATTRRRPSACRSRRRRRRRRRSCACPTGCTSTW